MEIVAVDVPLRWYVVAVLLRMRRTHTHMSKHHETHSMRAWSADPAAHSTAQQPDTPTTYWLIG